MGDRGSTVESHVARLFQFEPPMCNVHGRTGHGHALRLVRLAARQLTAVAQPLQGPLASARSCVPLRVRSITTGVSHLWSRSFLGPQSADASTRCWRLRRRIRDARLLLACPVLAVADSDPKARSVLRIRKEGKSIASTGKPGPNQRTGAFCPSVALVRPEPRGLGHSEGQRYGLGG